MIERPRQPAVAKPKLWDFNPQQARARSPGTAEIVPAGPALGPSACAPGGARLRRSPASHDHGGCAGEAILLNIGNCYNRPTPGSRKGVNDMLKGLAGATIWSEDLNNLLPFYRDLLGLKVAYELPDFVGFGERAASGGYTGAYLGLGTHSKVKGKPSDQYRHMVGLSSDGVDADFERLTADGVEFIEQPTDYGGLRIATLKDPEGNIIQLLQPVAT
ncbi:MAG: hypothetical protein E6J43_12260 [Chloroflexi bacterium]|nr:MAG: hypothetical protein E6J43_12260 [Chloroflexota bacterium]